MFHQARLKLTAWYLLILLIISVLFSTVIYTIIANQIEGLIHRQNERVQHYQEDQQPSAYPPRDHDDPPLIPVAELQNQKNQLLFTLLFVNGFIIILAGGAAYFLANRTLRPIKYMIDEQNQFISSSSHELRTPIATMRTEIETNLLEKHLSDQHAREILSSNLEELDSLQTLTNNLLKLAQIHNIHSLKFTEEVSLKEVITAAQKKVSPLAQKKNITITKEIEDAIILGEKGSLIEAFVILLENAIKYSPEKTAIEITTQVTRSVVKVYVKDQGIGIASTDLPHIFDRFYRADKSRVEEGFGLGLSIAKKTIETHHGSIQVKSTVGKGTLFIVSLPIHS